MAIRFNSILRQFGEDPKDVRLLRHKDPRALKGRTPYELWRNDPASFYRYQSTQSFKNRAIFSTAKIWASFVVTPSDQTLFAGLYFVEYCGVLEKEAPYENREGVQRAGSCDYYALAIDPTYADLMGRLIIEWGTGTKAWVQRADRQDKAIKELRLDFREPEFPGYLNFRASLSAIDTLYQSWAALLKVSRGVYLLTCPRTREQYVGRADGEHGFYQRWHSYLADGHGGNVGLKSRNPSDYQISILEVAGSAANSDDIAKMEERWKQKLQSREMGLNRN